MWLQIKPDFNTNTIKDCTQKLRIIASKDINEIELDIAEIEIQHVMSSSEDIHIISYYVSQKQDKLTIKLERTLYKDNTIDFAIRYSAGYYKENGILGIRRPRSGFYFVPSADGSPSKQAWTQGEALESKYWFPCVDDPQVKFPREIQVIVPENDFIVISNGELVQKEGNSWTWKEQNPTPAYLTSVVIGIFVQEQQEYLYDSDDNNDEEDCNRILLLYYWPKEISKKDAMLTFANTADMMRFFEEYFGMKYPYKKYSQVAVEEFESSGMENTSRTTLTKYILHDEKWSN